MKKVLFCSAIVVLLLQGCFSIIENRVKGNGHVTVEERQVTSFDELRIDGVFKVYFTQGDTEKVEVEIDENLQQYINVYHKRNALVVETRHATSRM